MSACTSTMFLLLASHRRSGPFGSTASTLRRNAHPFRRTPVSPQLHTHRTTSPPPPTPARASASAGHKVRVGASSLLGSCAA